MAKLIRVAITTGDADGIGTEIAAKALAKLRPQKNVLFFLWRSPSCPKKDLACIDSTFKRITVGSWPEALRVVPNSSKYLIDINSKLSPAHWVEQCALAAHHGHIDALATAPLSKTSIQQSGMRDIGHTDILKRVAKVENIFATFLGKKFNVVLATGHIPLQKVSTALQKEKYLETVLAAQKLKKILPEKWQKRPIALLGLNPHSGEQGLLGDEEQNIFPEVLSELKKLKIAVDGPLVPDAAFKPSNWPKYSVYVAAYHDQGLIPFKMIHGESDGIQISMGLPFIRTSVDHGTAKNIFGKNSADYGSMLEAIRKAIELAR